MLRFLAVLLLWSQIFSTTLQGVFYTFLPGVCQKYRFIDGDGDNDTSNNFLINNDLFQNTVQLMSCFYLW